MDGFGIRSALLVICISCFIAAIWLVSSPSFEKCSGRGCVVMRRARKQNQWLKVVPRLQSVNLAYRLIGAMPLRASEHRAPASGGGSWWAP